MRSKKQPPNNSAGLKQPLIYSIFSLVCVTALTLVISSSIDFKSILGAINQFYSAVILKLSIFEWGVWFFVTGWLYFFMLFLDLNGSKVEGKKILLLSLILVSVVMFWGIKSQELNGYFILIDLALFFSAHCVAAIAWFAYSEKTNSPALEKLAENSEIKIDDMKFFYAAGAIISIIIAIIIYSIFSVIEHDQYPEASKYITQKYAKQLDLLKFNSTDYKDGGFSEESSYTVKLSGLKVDIHQKNLCESYVSENSTTDKSEVCYPTMVLRDGVLKITGPKIENNSNHQYTNKVIQDLAESTLNYIIENENKKTLMIMTCPQQHYQFS